MIDPFGLRTSRGKRWTHEGSTDACAMRGHCSLPGVNRSLLAEAKASVDAGVRGAHPTNRAMDFEKHPCGALIPLDSER
jgi:hypothetical protein